MYSDKFCHYKLYENIANLIQITTVLRFFKEFFDLW